MSFNDLLQSFEDNPNTIVIKHRKFLRGKGSNMSKFTISREDEAKFKPGTHYKLIIVEDE